jgi:anti-anti-sigma factor
MQINQRQRGDVAVLELSGTLHCGSGERVLEQTIQEITRQGCVRIVMNLRDVTHIDTMCLGIFIAAQVRCQRQRGGVALLETPPRIRHLLSIARLNQFLPAFETEEEAVQAVSSVPTS